MKFSLNFIKEFLEVKMPAQDLVEALTMSGMEVENLEKSGNDWVFDIEVTSNRYDWLSLLGIAREVAVCLGKKLDIKYPKVVKEPVLLGRKIVIEDSNDCIFYVGRVIRGLNISASPLWLKQRVINCGINSINSVVDVTNYCMLKWGNPLHAFDYDKLKGDIFVRRAKKNEEFIGIDGKERILSKDNLVIADAEKVIALAGVIGAKNSEVDETTKNIFLEAALFLPLSIRRSRRSVGLDTESSYRFERMVNPQYLEFASEQAANLIKELSGGVFFGYKEAGKNPTIKPKRIMINFSSLSDYLGLACSASAVRQILERLGFKTESISKETAVFLAPLFRFDIQREVDIYEEFSRIYGFDKIPSSLPAIKPKVKEPNSYEFKKEVRRLLVSMGLNEAVTFSIESEEELTGLGYENLIKIANPLRKKENVMRPSLCQGLLKTIKYNLNRSQSNVSFFEIANIYSKLKSGFEETSQIGIAYSQGFNDFFFLKGLVNRLLDYFDIVEYEFKPESAKNMSNSLSIVVGGQSIGCLGKIDRQVKKDLGIKEDLFFSQINLQLLMKARGIKKYQPFSNYPAVCRDISIALRKDKKFADVEKIIVKKSKDYFSSLEILDRYQGQDLEKNYQAFTLRIFYQLPERTLTSDEIDSLHLMIRDQLNAQDGIQIR